MALCGLRYLPFSQLNFIEELKSHACPGNVRELEHLIERSILLTEENIFEEIQSPKSRNERKDDQADLSQKALQDIERSYIIEIWRRYDGKITGMDGATGFLGIPSTTLHSKMTKTGISKADYFPKKGLNILHFDLPPSEVNFLISQYQNT